MKAEDTQYMRMAIELALKEWGGDPNPLVGAVIVKDGAVIGQGYHQQYGSPPTPSGTPLAACTESSAGATVYVTSGALCHHGKNPPCTEALIQAGVSRVVVGSKDPNSLVAGKGIAQLRAAGIQVEEGFKGRVQPAEPIFFHYITTGQPYVALKYAMSADGKIACHTGLRWVTERLPAPHVHLLRNRYAAIMVGVETVLADDPELTCRLENGHNPSALSVTASCARPFPLLVATASKVPTVIATCIPDASRHRALSGLRLSGFGTCRKRMAG